MRILLTADPFIPVPPKLYGGIERVIDGMIRGLRAGGDTVGLLAHADSHCDTDARYAWSHAHPDRLIAHWQCARDLRAAVRDFKPDIVHSFSRLAYLLAAGLGAVPRVMSYQRQPSVRTVRWASAVSGRRLHFTGCSEHIAAQGRSAGGVWEAIPNFIDSQRLNFVASVADDAPLVFLSRVESIKGADTAIAIARGSNRKLLIAGNAPESGVEATWFQQAVMSQVDGEQIQYIGPVDDVQKNVLLGSAAAMVVPIRWDEPFGIVFAEALACGTPVISCARGALPEIVSHGTHGFLIADVDEGVAAVRALPTIDRATCRQRALSHFSEAAVVPQYRHLYRRLIEAGA